MTPPASGNKFRSYVPDKTEMREFTTRAVLLGLVMTVVLGAANLYLGLRAGMTIAATYPAAVIGMAILRLMKGSILEENMARTIGSIGESVAAGAVFTIPAFVLAGVWPAFDLANGYWKSVALMAVGGTLGILFVTLLRRVMVEDPDLPFPESVAAAEIYKAGQQGARAAKILFANMGVGAVLFFLGAINVFAASRDFVLHVGEVGKSMVKLIRAPGSPVVQAGAMSTFSAPAISPAYLGVGYIIGPRLGALNFAGGVFAWGLLVPLLAFFLGPQLAPGVSGEDGWAKVAGAIWFHIVRHLVPHRAPHRGGRHDGGRVVHAVPHAQEFGHWHEAGGGGPEEIGGGPRSCRPHAARPEQQGGIWRVRGGFHLYDRPLLLLCGRHRPGGSGGRRHDRPRILLRGGLRQPGRYDRLVEQPHLGSDAVHGGDLRPVDGGHGTAWQLRHRGRAGRGGGGLRFVGRGRGDAAGFESRAHPGRHPRQDADRRSAGYRGVQHGAVLPADVAAPRLHVRHAATAGAASGADGIAGDGHCRRQHGVAAGGSRYLHGIRPDPGGSEEPHAVLGGDVPAARDHVRHLRRRAVPLGHRQTTRQGQLQRRAEGPYRKHRRVDSLRPDRGRGAVRAGGGRLQSRREKPGPSHPARRHVVGNGLAGRAGAGRTGDADDPPPAG